MERKVLFGIDYTNNETVKLLLYLFVGGTAALVEWGLFYLLFNYVFSAEAWELALRTSAATATAFSLSTIYHYFLGNILVFNSGSRYGKSKEISLVFLVSVMGLVFNLLLMYIFVNLCGWQALLSKVLSSCIVVAWNYLARKKFIFGS